MAPGDAMGGWGVVVWGCRALCRSMARGGPCWWSYIRGGLFCVRSYSSARGRQKESFGGGAVRVHGLRARRRIGSGAIRSRARFGRVYVYERLRAYDE